MLSGALALALALADPAPQGHHRAILVVGGGSNIPRDALMKYARFSRDVIVVRADAAPFIVPIDTSSWGGHDWLSTPSHRETDILGESNITAGRWNLYGVLRLARTTR